jgi:hypothetical protein
LFLTAAALAFGAESPWLRSLGLGIMAPGAGFILWIAGDPVHALIHAALAAAVMASFVAALIVWFATGNVIAPIMVWAMAAIAAAAMNHEEQWQDAPWAVTAAIMLLASAAAALMFLRRRMGLSGRRRDNVVLRQHVRLVETPEAAELTADDIALLRLLLDRALQPLDAFDGFDSIEQFQTSALRYQLSFAGYALSLFQHAHAPAFHGYLTTAQGNLIRKHTDPRVWGYWALENRWGNLNADPDPMGRDNVMFTGFVAAQIAAFESASGNEQFSAPGSLQFRQEGGPCFAHDLPGMVETLRRNIEASAFSLIACEPNWVFPLCNSIAFAAIAKQSPAIWEGLALRLLDAIDAEFLDPGGQLVACRSAYLGVALSGVGGAAVQALPCFFLNASLPALAERQWLLERNRFLPGGHLTRGRFWPVDTGNYGLTRASSYAATAAAAVEMGDAEAARALLDMLEKEHPAAVRQGVRHRAGVSLWAHAAELMARAGARDAFRTIMTGRPRQPSLAIAEAAYPAVLPARAISRGGALSCVLYPGGAPGPVEIGLSGLRPGGSYNSNGKPLTALPDGTVRLTLALEGRTELLVTPLD